MNIFRFKVKGFDHDNDYYFTNCGLGVCESYSDAARSIEDYFDNELISIEKIEVETEICLDDPMDCEQKSVIIKIIDKKERKDYEKICMFRMWLCL